ncbi:unnamed protein product [Cyberlindnera jadinii]|uniref:RRM domain-containing protein n=1 Tax=Cyberlindnera jadinii (strain ATCC 18201 / CBS 1600 / BCRC 20928 / JCM 3617 / NBRC 0987 / NRRL Y-1542) TaxID=983966 RepID=A0A0H5C9T9_CYBJN|nr:hypothetical protein CYBJADRAFT_169328 [Cyberlindnera jadinii NRRL Y-1542]ODV71471.1 hypothetical protein CYBJADRAFT_169328 [Cyberlindnera jadinii NRRL Y-1542]CEP25195.1 unnamed protein product [Cyberlindnera jadinii]
MLLSKRFLCTNKSANSNSILVPSHTVRGFHSYKQRSLGIAYIDFENGEEASIAMELLNGLDLNGRPLRAKKFILYSPGIKRVNSKPKGRDKRSKAKSIVLSSLDEEDLNEKEKVINTPNTGDANNEDRSNGSSSRKKSKPVSDTTVYIGRLSSKITDGDLREYFHDYVPTEVYIFKTRSPKHHRSLFGASNSALITLSVDHSVTKALEELKDVKLKGKRVYLQHAYISKIEEVKNAVRAKALRWDLENSSPTDDGAQEAAQEAAQEVAQEVPQE